MTGRVMFLLWSTFFMGVFAGVYLYISAFAPSYEDGVAKSEDIDEDDFVIEGEMYGACEEDGTCASFRIRNGRDYTYVSSAYAQVEKGKFPSSVRAYLNTALTRAVLEENAKESASGACISGNGSIAYAYTITKDGIVYELDTCTTEFAFNTDLQERLLDVWFLLENKEAPDSLFDQESEPLPNVFDLFWDRFHSGAS